MRLLVTWHDDIANGRRLELRKEGQRPIGETWQVRALIGEYVTEADAVAISEAAEPMGGWQGARGEVVRVGEFKEASVLWTVGFSTPSGARDFFERKVKEWHRNAVAASARRRT